MTLRWKDDPLGEPKVRMPREGEHGHENEPTHGIVVHTPGKLVVFPVRRVTRALLFISHCTNIIREPPAHNIVGQQ